MFKKKNEIVKTKTLSLSEEKGRIEKGYSPVQVTTPSSSMPFGNTISRRRIESYTRVVEAETGLFKALKRQRLALDDLMTVDVDIAIQRMEKELGRAIMEEELAEYYRRRSQRESERE